tara:strand:- start:4019 stop:4840 length:822 start_codon:yes stop_codon:yes gene_type:complete
VIDTIYIPTFRRPNNQKCFDNLPDKYKKKVIMVVQEQEKDEYDYDVEYLIVGNDIGIAATREQIYNHASKKRYLMVDDDITFYRRNRKYMKVESNMERSKRPLSSNDWDDMFELFNGWMDEGLMHVGCRDSNLIPSEKFYHEFQYVSGAHFINGEELSKWKDEVDWKFVKVAEDSILNLECLLRGFKNRISDEFVCDIFGSMWTNEGGLENIRSPQVHYEENIKLMNNPRYKPYTYIKKKIEIKNYGVIDVFKHRFKEAYNSSKYINKLEEFK